MIQEKYDKKRHEQELERLKGRYRATFETDEGQKVLENLRSVCYYDRPVAANSGTTNIDPLAMAFKDGMRNVVIYINTMLKKETNE